jgi:uncharacterized membrane protein
MDTKAKDLCFARLAMVGSIVGVILVVVAAWQGAWPFAAINGGVSVASALLAVRCYRLAARAS